MNFSETPTVKNPREFLAVILAGFGNELQPLTSNYGDQPCPKALLPVGNRPMISYVLNWVEETGINEVLLICPTSHRDALSHHINSDPSSSSLSTLSIDIQTFDQSQDLAAGTVSVLAHFASRIAGDFVLLPCDFFPPPSLRLESVLNKFRVEALTDGALATALFFERRTPDKKSGDDDAWVAPSAPSAVLYDAKSGTLLHVDTLDDQDRNLEELELRMGMLNSYPRVRLSTRLIDAHVYVCRQAVLAALQRKTRAFDSIREEFIPWLCKVQTQRTKRDKYGDVLNPITNNPAPYSLALQHSTSHHQHRSKKTKSRKNPTSPHSQLSSPNPNSESEFIDAEAPSLRIGLVIHRQSEGYAARANDIYSYLELNRNALKDIPPQSYDPALVDPKSNISADSLVGESSRVGERTSVKRSVIGRHCVLGKNVKISNCVLMEYCVIDDGAKLEGCVLGKNTHIGAKADLTRCATQAGFEVEAGGVYKNEKLEVSDWTAGAENSGTEDDASDADDCGDESDE